MKFEKQKQLIKQALKEDIGREDITTNAIVPITKKIRAIVVVKENGVIAGLDIVKQAFKELDRKIIFIKKVNDGDFVKKGKIIAEIKGSARAVLTGERVALNILQRLSGIATLTRKFVKLAGKIKIKDTRKTTPGLRELEKYAVKVGGGTNHRIRLDDAVLIKDNHIKIAGSVTEAIRRAKKIGKKIEVEVTNMKELKEAIGENADSILLDNMTPNQIKKAKSFAKGKILEVSGGTNLKNIRSFAKTGVDYISVGALTHSPRALDMSLEVLK